MFNMEKRERNKIIIIIIIVIIMCVNGRFKATQQLLPSSGGEVKADTGMAWDSGHPACPLCEASAVVTKEEQHTH